MKKRIVSIIVCVLMLAGITACGVSPEAPQPTAEPIATQPPEVTAEPTPDEGTEENEEGTAGAPTEAVTVQQLPEPVPEPTPEPVSAAPATKEAAQAYIGASANAMAAAIGAPNGKNYSSSCLGDGEDGEWYYNDFTVYTYSDANGEQVIGVR